MKNFNKVYNEIVKEDTDFGSVLVKLELNLDAVRKIESRAGADIKALLENEINNNPEAFIEMLGYGNE